MGDLHHSHLLKYIPDSFEELLEYSHHSIHIYKHKPTGEPFGVVVCSHKGRISGGIIFYLNIEIKTPIDQMEIIMKYAERQLIYTEPQSYDDYKVLLKSAMDKLIQDIKQTNGFTIDKSSIPVVATKSQTETVSHHPPPPHIKKDEAPIKCIMCGQLSLNTNIIAICKKCSSQLKITVRKKYY